MQVFTQPSMLDETPDDTVVVLDELYDAPQIDGDVDVAQNIMERARNSMMTIRIGCGRIPLFAETKEAQDAIRKELGVSEDTEVSGKISRLGAMWKDAKVVNSAMSKIRTYTYEETSPFIRGERTVMVEDAAQVVSDCRALEAAVEVVAADFMPRYEAYYKAQGGKTKTDMGSSKVKMMTPAEVRRSIWVEIGLPQPLPACDLSGLNLPAELAAQISSAAFADQFSKLASTHQDILDKARKELERVKKQVTVGKRFHDSLVPDVIKVAKRLRSIAEGYDSDMRLVVLADTIEDQIGQYTTDQLRNGEAAKATAERVADFGLATLDDVAKHPVAPPVQPHQPKAADTDTDFGFNF